METQTEQREAYQLVTEKPVNMEATTRIELDIRKPKKTEVTAKKKVLSVIESDPFQMNSQRRYMMLTEQERRDIKQGNPELNVRVADKEETLENLCIRDDAMSEEDGEQKVDNRELDMQERLKHYNESMRWIQELQYKCWVFHNKELLRMPDGKVLRWYWWEDFKDGLEGVKQPS